MKFVCAEAVDWRCVQRVADVGSGEGSLLAHLLCRHDAMQGRLLERPRTARRARRRLDDVGLGRRCRVVEGGFFDAVPSGPQAYLLCFALHNCDDERCARLLACCRQAMAGDAVLYVVEQVREGPGGSALAYFGLPALELLGGKERSPAEFRRLLRRAGLRLAGIATAPGNPFAMLAASCSRRPLAALCSADRLLVAIRVCEKAASSSRNRFIKLASPTTAATCRLVQLIKGDAKCLRCAQ